MVKKVEKLGYKAIMLTVDTTILGKRENDMRAKALSAVSMAHFATQPMSRNRFNWSQDVDESQLGIARQMGSFYDENLGWDALPWLRVCRHACVSFSDYHTILLPWQGITRLPIIIKGIQCVEDVEIAHEHGAAAVVLSNHGVRVMYFELGSGQLIRRNRDDS